VATNRAQRRLRAISDEHCDDTAVEMDCVEAARLTYRVTKVALMDGMVTEAEAKEIVDALAATVRLAEDSLRRNVAVEQQLTAFSQELATRESGRFADPAHSRAAA
jgi:hypothetical protein